MSRNLTDGIGTIAVAQSLEAHGLQVFGLRWEVADGLDYATMDEALAARALEVTEVGTSGTVTGLRAVNHSDRMVFLMAGEELVGAKQNRVLNASMMLGARADLTVPVSCVEQGRWAFGTKRSLGRGLSSHSHLRHLLSKMIHASYRVEGKPSSDQMAVWAEVLRKLGATGSKSPSHALHEVYEALKSRLDEMVAAIPAPAGCCGAAFAFGGRIVGADLFDHAATLDKIWPKVLKAYAIDSLEAAAHEASAIPASSVAPWLQSAASAKSETFKSVGLGEDVRLEAEQLVGAALVVEGHPVHLELFAEVTLRTEADRSAESPEEAAAGAGAGPGFTGE